TMHGVFAPIHSRDFGIKEARTLTRVAHPKNSFRTANFGNECAAEKALKVQRDVRLQPACLPHPGKQTAGRAESAKFTARKNMDMIDVAISAQEWCPFGVDDPRNFRIGLS